MLRIIKFDMYRFFFPMGWLFGFWGAFLWILYALNFTSYPGALHPEVMMGGFLLCFVSGFLMTAAPKFTNSYPPTLTDLRLSVFFTSLLFVSLMFHQPIYFRFAVLLEFLFLSWFVGNRFIKRKANPPVVFLFIGFGLMSGLVGNILLITGQFVQLGRLLFLHAYILSLVLGIGSRLVPALMGAEPTNFKMKTVVIVAIVFFSSFFIEVFISSYAGSMLRSLVILLIAIFAWKIHQLPKRKAMQSWGLWLSCWSLVIGSLGASFFPEYRIHLMHLVFISGLSLLTLMIATRVSLSHGKHDMNLEMKSRHLQAAIILFILAALARVSAGFFTTYYQSHLVCASLIWIAGLFMWGWAFLPKIFKTGDL